MKNILITSLILAGIFSCKQKLDDPKVNYGSTNRTIKLIHTLNENQEIDTLRFVNGVEFKMFAKHVQLDDASITASKTTVLKTLYTAAETPGNPPVWLGQDTLFIKVSSLFGKIEFSSLPNDNRSYNSPCYNENKGYPDYLEVIELNGVDSVYTIDVMQDKCN